MPPSRTANRWSGYGSHLWGGDRQVVAAPGGPCALTLSGEIVCSSPADNDFLPPGPFDEISMHWGAGIEGDLFARKGTTVYRPLTPIPSQTPNLPLAGSFQSLGGASHRNACPITTAGSLSCK
jgi:hypothetical protein